MMKAIWKILHKEAGMTTLALVLMLVMVGALMLPPLLSLIFTASKAGQVEEDKTKVFYSADAGVTAGRWRVTQGGSNLPSWMVTNTLGDSRWLESTFAHNPAYENYTLSSGDPINDNNVFYQITPKWTLGDGTSTLETYNSVQKRDPAVNIAVYGAYNGSGSVSGRASYKIDIVYPGGDGTVKIGRIGCWLPAGFDYVAGTSSLEKTSTTAIKKVPVVSNYRGGHTITWDYTTPVDYNSFLEGQLSKASVTFEYTPGSATQGDFSWIRTDKTTGANFLAWDMDLKMWEIKSTATSPTGEKTTATAYTFTVEAQPFGSTMEGDCWAFGNTLMRDTDSDNNRDRLYLSSNSTVSAIPANATIKYIYLYWSGWKCKPWNGMSSTDNWTARCQLYKVDKVNLKIAYPATATPLFSENVTATQMRGAINYSGTSTAHGWSYACFADITDRVKAVFAGTPGFVGNGMYTVGHADNRTAASSLYRYRLYTWKDSHSSETYTNYTPYPLGSPLDGGTTNSYSCEDVDTSAHCSANTYPYEASQDNWAYAAWSIIIIYSSPSTSGHLLRIYDTFQYVGESTAIPIKFAGFSTPPLAAENTAARYTHFVGEGDSAYNESITIKGSGTTYTLSDSDNPSNNPCNNQCRIPPVSDPNPGTLIQGIDIDTFNVPKTCIMPGDTEATVTFTTQSDSIDLIYMILSFRSKFTPGGISIFRVE